MQPALSEGAMEKILKKENIEKPIFQILGHKRVGVDNERYRLLLSDGKSINSYTMLATQLNHLIRDNELTEYSICEISKYAISTVETQGKKRLVMVILGINQVVPGNKVGKKIGNPTALDNSLDGDTRSSTENSVAQNNDTVHKDDEQDKKPVIINKPMQNGSSVCNNKAKRMKMDMSDVSTTPIAALSPYQNRFVIKAAVMSKSNIRNWKNSRGEGHVFSMEVADESGDIKVTAFNDACDKFFETIIEGKTYYISHCIVKSANKQFSRNEYELTLTTDSQIVASEDKIIDIPAIQFQFIPISEIEHKKKDDLIDVLGIIKSSGDVQKLTKRSTGEELRKREVNIVDESNTMITFTLWNKAADEFSAQSGSVMAIREGRVGEFNGGKNISTGFSSIVQIDPDIPEAHKLRGWYNTFGQSEESKSLSKGATAAGGVTGEWITFKESKDKKLGYNGPPDFYVVKATVNMIQVENSMYKACPSESCKKKVVDQSNGIYRCEKCNKEYPKFKYMLVGKVHLLDWTEHEWVTAFNEQAEKLLNTTAETVGKMKDEGNDEYLDIFAQAAFKSYIFKLKASLEHYNDEGRIRTTCMSITPLDYKVYNTYLLSKIHELIDMEKI